MLDAYLQHGPWGGPYRTEKVPVKVVEPPTKGQTQSGYGKNLPTHYMVQHQGIWLRVKCVCFSNAGTLWASVRGVKTVVRIDEH